LAYLEHKTAGLVHHHEECMAKLVELSEGRDRSAPKG
jgi:hypothetical protein